MKRLLMGCGFLIVLPFSVAACYWDSDTPQSEAQGLPEVVASITGRFPKNPPLYYAIRLKRVAAEIQEHPDHLEAYDDAGVACDRLGRGDEAIGWMEKKKQELDKLDSALPVVKEQSYRYHANLGTFLVHRWIRNGADRSRIQEVEAARDEIAKAMEINPNAHFGREKYQLAVLKWIVDPPSLEGLTDFQDLPNVLGRSYDPYDEHPSVAPKEADEAVRGLSGLVVLGNAWESVDVFFALNRALQSDTVGFPAGTMGGRNTLAYFAWLRSVELADAGKRSILPGSPQGKTLKNHLGMPRSVDTGKILEPAFRKLRAEAESWNQGRTAFMMKRLEKGRHPDTDIHFWDGYREAPAPALPGITDAESGSIRKEAPRRGWKIWESVVLVMVIAVIGFEVAFRVFEATLKFRKS